MATWLNLRVSTRAAEAVRNHGEGHQATDPVSVRSLRLLRFYNPDARAQLIPIPRLLVPTTKRGVERTSHPEGLPRQPSSGGSQTPIHSPLLIHSPQPDALRHE